MFTLFDLIRLLAIALGAVFLGTIGWQTFGILGCLIGVPMGLALGAIIGQLPLIIARKWVSQRFGRMSNEELVDELHDPACTVPNMLLLELKQREFDIQRELPFVQTLLASDEMHRRIVGWVALTSAFPELVGQIPRYNPTAPAAACRLHCKQLLDAGLNGEGEPS